MSKSQLEHLTAKLVTFRDARDWKQFHNPKDLAAALSIEAAELQELFLWKSPDQIDLSDPAKKTIVEEEVADIAAYLLLLCNELDIDLEEALSRKIDLNAAKYPADKVRGSSKKYTEYSEEI